MRRIAFALCAAAALGACTTPNTDTGASSAAAAVDPASPLAAPTYMQLAASGDMFEIESSRLALQMSRNPTIQAFAQQLINDHSRLSSELMTTAQSAGLTPPPPSMAPHHAQMLEQLRANPAAFDMAYRDAQITAHNESLQLHQNYASGGDNAALRAVAARAVPVVQGHLSHVQSLNVAAPVQQAPQAGERG